MGGIEPIRNGYRVIHFYSSYGIKLLNRLVNLPFYFPAVSSNRLGQKSKTSECFLVDDKIPKTVVLRFFRTTKFFPGE